MLTMMIRLVFADRKTKHYSPTATKKGITEIDRGGVVDDQKHLCGGKDESLNILSWRWLGVVEYERVTWTNMMDSYLCYIAFTRKALPETKHPRHCHWKVQSRFCFLVLPSSKCHNSWLENFPSVRYRIYTHTKSILTDRLPYKWFWWITQYISRYKKTTQNRVVVLGVSVFTLHLLLPVLKFWWSIRLNIKLQTLTQKHSLNNYIYPKQVFIFLTTDDLTTSRRRCGAPWSVVGFAPFIVESLLQRVKWVAPPQTAGHFLERVRNAGLVDKVLPKNFPHSRVPRKNEAIKSYSKKLEISWRS